MVTGTVGELIGLSAYIEIGALNRFMGDSDVVSGISVALDKSREKDFFAYLKGHPKIATSGSKTAMLLGVIEPAAPALLDARTERELSARVGAAKAIQARADAGVTRARSSLEKSRADRRRSRALAGRAFISPAQLEQAALAAQLATRDLEMARHTTRVAGFDTAAARAAVLRLHSDGGKTSDRQRILCAPVAGRVLRVMQENEGVVAIGTPLVEIGAPGDNVEISRQNDSEAMVSSGLRRGEQVVVYPGDGLTDDSA